MQSRMLAASLVLLGGLLLPYDRAAGAGVRQRGQVPGVARRLIRVSDDRYPAHAEPSLAVNPRNPRVLLGAAQLIGPGVHTVGTFASADGGQTWRDGGPLPLPRGANWADDVTVTFDERGTGFVVAMATTFSAQGLSRYGRGVYVWRTDDGGRSFHGPMAIARGQFADHPWLAAATTPGSGAVYVAWTADGGLAFSRSLDDGRRFSAPRIISAPPGGALVPMVAAGPAGTVYVVYERGLGSADAPDADAVPSAPSSGAALRTRAAAAEELDTSIDVIGSTDYGQRFGQPATVGTAAYNLSPAPRVQLPTAPSVTTDPRDGAIYVAYAAPRQGRAILVARSRANGRTWAVATGIANGASGGQTSYFQPQLTVDGAGGVDMTCFALAHGRVDVLLTRSTNAAARFQRPLRITPTPFDPSLSTAGSGGKHGLWWIGDYQGLAAGGGWIYPFWNDTRTGHLEIFTAAIHA